MNNLLKVVFLLPLLAASGQYSVPTHTGAVSSSAPCNPPALLTSRWSMWNPSNTCNGGGACTNGALMDNALDSVGTANLTQTGGSRPVYVASAINGLAAAQMATGSGKAFGGTLTAGVNGPMTWFAVTEFVSGGSGVLVGRGGIPSGTFEWRMSATQQEILKNQVVSIGTASSTYTSGNWYAILVQYNQPTGAYTFYNCAGGTCTSIGSGTNAQTFSQVVDSLGSSVGDGSNGGYIAEVTLYLGTSTTGYGAYALCKYGI
jgi:hypothetical protein